MIPTVTYLRLNGVARRHLPLLVLGPSLGTSASTLWSACAAHLENNFDVVAWDLPGHGSNSAVAAEGFTMAELAAGVLAMAEEVMAARAEVGGSFALAGDSVGGAVSLQLLLDAPSRVSSAVLLCTGAKIGDSATWQQRVEAVEASGTSELVASSAARWFGPGFAEREPALADGLLSALRDTNDHGYVQVCAALATFDVRDRMAEIEVPVLAVAGADDMATPVENLRHIAHGVVNGVLVELPGVAHLAPAEAPERVAALIRGHALPEASSRNPTRYDAGLAVRREVLGNAHVDRALASRTELTGDFQDFITEYAWGGIWTRPGLDRRSRSLITLTALVARGHQEELAMHVRAALTNGLTPDEIKECLLQTAIYCGVPDANTAFRIAQQVITEIAHEESS